MTPEESVETARSELATGIGLLKCQKCGCMQDALKNLAGALPAADTSAASALAVIVADYQKQMRPVQYSCLGCERCYPAVAQNALAQAFPALQAPGLSCVLEMQEGTWPPAVGEYLVLDRAAPVAVSTLASVALAADLAGQKPKGLAIVGKTETENIGIDKIVKNVIANPALRHLILAGIDPKGHWSGKTLLALAENGIDEKGRVIGSIAKRPVLRNVSLAEVQAFRDQVQVIDMIGCENAAEIAARIQELDQAAPSCGCHECASQEPFAISLGRKITAREPEEVVRLDEAGYFVIIPLPDRGLINVEYYAYDNTLLKVIEGASARAVYTTIIRNRWVTELSHAAYLGKELTRAELAIKHGFQYVQDGA